MKILPLKMMIFGRTGHDLALASRLVGAAGRTVGIDLTPQMLTRNYASFMLRISF